ncbi:hypothetical protein BB560_006033 [Smittium megazygosporum]|uniref:Uncharacterized protein n=1 Tax=Smittium megazygosporum TaxID=133381 RepID=A0A2T9YK37_9FUNG|nr:hypothetical protein BB560_006033 [Smittium megazygosporum]
MGLKEILLGKECLMHIFKERIFYISVVCGYSVYKAVYYIFLDPLRKIPGPWWAKFTDKPYKRVQFTKDTTEYSLSLHKKYGSVVRVGPKTVSRAQEKNTSFELVEYE